MFWASAAVFASLKILPSKINTEMSDRSFRWCDLFLGRQLRLAETDEVFVITKVPADFGSNRMDAALIFM